MLQGFAAIFDTDDGWQQKIQIAQNHSTLKKRVNSRCLVLDGQGAVFST
jgi:hypothetical protein